MTMTSNNLDTANLNPGPDDLNKPTSEPLHVEAISGATVISQEANELMNNIIKGN